MFIPFSIGALIVEIH